MNGAFANDVAKRFAARLDREGKPTLAQVELAYRLAAGGLPRRKRWPSARRFCEAAR